MKKALKLLLMFLIFLAVGMVLGTIFYSLYLNSLNLVVGKSTDLFSKTNFTEAFFFTGEILCFLIGIFLISYRIRHPGGALQLVAFILTQALCWGFLFPSFFFLESRYIAKHHEEIEAVNDARQLTKGFFRVHGSDVYYFLEDLEIEDSENEDCTVAVKIDSTETGTVELIEVDNPSALDVVTQAQPYTDIIVKKAFSTSRRSFLSFFYNIVEIARIEYSKGWSFWLGFISLGLALGSVYALSGLSSWRLINFTITTITSVGILYWNYIFTTPALENFRNLKLVSIQLGSLNNHIDNVFLFFSNLLVGIVLILIGTITHFVNEKRKNN